MALLSLEIVCHQATNEFLGNSEKPVIQLAREATTLLSWAIDGIGDPFAIHGFASDGRHDVQYFRFKDFDQPYDDDAKARLAGMRGGLSTRMGAAMRHAEQFLSKSPQRKKLLLLVSDGESADIDVRPRSAGKVIRSIYAMILKRR
jgi:nitric oxide reductase activation protein